MAGHAQLKFVMTECSKTQIRLTGPIYTCMLSGAELTKMADLNNFCNGGYAIFDLNMRHETLDKQLKCVCPHGKYNYIIIIVCLLWSFSAQSTLFRSF